jgi:hypothetical protein
MLAIVKLNEVEKKWIIWELINMKFLDKDVEQIKLTQGKMHQHLHILLQTTIGCYIL